jgi:MFS family permease
MFAVMAVLIFTHVIEMWHVYAIAFGTGCGFALNQPVRTSIVPSLVDRKDMLNAVTLNSIAMNSSRLIGPAIIATVIQVTSTGAAYVWAAGIYGVVILTTLQIHLPETVGRLKGSAFRQLAEGFAYMKENRLVLALVLLGLAPLSIGFSHQTLLPQLVDERLGQEPGMYGYIISVGAIGGLTGALFVASRQTVSHKGYWMIAASLFYGFALLGFASVAATKILLLAFPLIIVVGASQNIFRAMNTTTLMETTPDQLRGRVMSVMLLDTALAPVAGLAAGAAADKWGVDAGYLLLGSACVVVVALMLLFYPKVRNL